jgi:hypothetical protein
LLLPISSFNPCVHSVCTPNAVCRIHEASLYHRCICPEIAAASLTKQRLLDYETLFSQNRSVCAACGTKKKDLKGCGGCWLARYCGEECQRKDLASHKRTCKLLRAVVVSAAGMKLCGRKNTEADGRFYISVPATREGWVIRWVCTQRGLRELREAVTSASQGLPILIGAAHQFVVDVLGVKDARLAAPGSEDDEHPENDMDAPRGVCLDIQSCSAEQLAEELKRVLAMPFNYISVKLGPAAALICVSRAFMYDEDGEPIEYIGISRIGVRASQRRQGHMLALLRRIEAATALMGRQLFITEVYSPRLRSILLKHPEEWKPCSSFGQPEFAMNFMKI